MRIALAQTDAVLGDIAANAATAERLIDDATAQGAEMVVFPELSLSGFSVGEIPEDISLGLDDKHLVGLGERTEAGVLVGFPEAQTHGLHTYNSAAYFEGRRLMVSHSNEYRVPGDGEKVDVQKAMRSTQGLDERPKPQQP